MKEQSPKHSHGAKKGTKSLRWSLGLFRNERGELCAVYVTKKGVVAPYLRKRVNGSKILYHGVYSGMTYAQARAALVRDSKLRDAPVKKAAKAAPEKKAA